MILPADQPFFDKLGCENILELALLVPTAFEDTTLYPAPKLGAKQAVEVTVLQKQHLHKNLKIELFAHNFDLKLSAMIFHPKPYHHAIFKKDAQMVLFGTIESTPWGLTMAQPRKITQVGTIVPHFPTTLRQDSHAKIVVTYITVEKLCAAGLPRAIAHTLVGMFHPSRPEMARYNVEGVTQKQRHALKVTELFNYMSKLALKRFAFPAMPTAITPIDAWIKTLPFELTGDQHRAIASIRDDLMRGQAAKRMIIGDVGAGKTMVILATAMLNRSGKTILMAPTTLLAVQLYEEAQKFLPLNTVLITNKERAIQALDAYDFIIGTHALLYRTLPHANVVMIDEQHRFGTKQRHMIDKLVQHDQKRPHLFQFSATPIPRTQAMVNSALLDVSLIEETPFKKDITTQLIGKNYFPKLIDHIKSEIAKDHQVLIVYPLVEASDTMQYQSIEEARGYWEKHFEGVYVTHGKDKEKEQVLLDFRTQGKILLATTVIEVGISLPRLSTIVIVGAERLGFATLHQLRGRVSRTGLKGWCFLFTHAVGSQRLEEFSQISNGFDIAKLDLKYRQSGDMLSGKRQSGSKYLWFDEATDEEIVIEVKALMN